jgi:hypothetical protein
MGSGFDLLLPILYRRVTDGMFVSGIPELAGRNQKNRIVHCGVHALLTISRDISMRPTRTCGKSENPRVFTSHVQSAGYHYSEHVLTH